MTTTNPVPARLARVRAALAKHAAYAVLVPSADPHLSEYLPAHWQGREWLSGFTGSMGTLVVTKDAAALFADSRYWQQAETQLAGSGIELQKIPTGASMHHVDWLTKQVPRGATVVVDGMVLGLAAAQQLQAALDAAGVALNTKLDVLNDAWPDRAGLPQAPVYEHRQPEAGESRAQRLARVREAMQAAGATHHFVSSVDDIAWITSLRGADVEYNPVFLAHLLLDANGGTLFVGQGKVDADLAARLAADGLRLDDYAAAGPALAALNNDAVVLVDPKRITLGLRAQLPVAVKVIEALNPSVYFKSRKSAADAAHIREAMIEDGAAMCEFYAWFEQALGKERITELTVDERISAERAKRPGFVGLSFSTIAGFNANGAMPHYRAMPESHSVIEGNGLLLIDSGGQYFGGTTDITRVWKIGDITPAHKRDFTLVLKGTMALSRTRFPRGTLAPRLDAIARAPLWADGLDYGHGTGHGVGYFLNVHEGPQSISSATAEAHHAMEPGMVTSIEPGVYRAGKWGVRIENLVLNVPVATAENGEFGDILEFETLTLCPIDTRCIDRALLRDDEIDWLNAYHATVRERLSPRVTPFARAWLEARTAPL